MARLFPPIKQSVKFKQTAPPGGGIAHVFDGGGSHHTTQGWPKILAEGAVVHFNGQWHQKMRGTIKPLTRNTIPAEVRATILLLSLNL